MTKGYIKAKANPGPLNMLKGFSFGASAMLLWIKETYHLKSSEIFPKYPAKSFICEQCKYVLFEYDRISEPSFFTRRSRSTIQLFSILVIIGMVLFALSKYYE